MPCTLPPGYDRKAGHRAGRRATPTAKPRRTVRRTPGPTVKTTTVPARSRLSTPQATPDRKKDAGPTVKTTTVPARSRPSTPQATPDRKKDAGAYREGNDRPAGAAPPNRNTLTASRQGFGAGIAQTVSSLTDGLGQSPPKPSQPPASRQPRAGHCRGQRAGRSPSSANPEPVNAGSRRDQNGGREGQRWEGMGSKGWPQPVPAADPEPANARRKSGWAGPGGQPSRGSAESDPPIGGRSERIRQRAHIRDKRHQLGVRVCTMPDAP